MTWLNVGEQSSNEKSKKARVQRKKAERIRAYGQKERRNEIPWKFKQDRLKERHELIGTFKS